MIKSIKKEFKYFYWLLKNRYLQFSLYREIFFSLVLFHLPFISFDFKLLHSSPKAIPFLKKNYFKFLFNINFSKVIKNQFNALEGEEIISLNKLNKLCWLIATFRKDHQLLDSLINFLKNKDNKNIHIFENRHILNESFYRLGDFSSYDKFILFLRDRQNKLLGRKAGFYNEEGHFTAIGHICLLAYLLQAIDCGYLKKSSTEYSFVYDKDKVKNKLLAEIIKNYAIKLNLDLIEKTYTNLNFSEVELEIWPSQINTNNGILARREYYKVAKNISNKNSNYFLKVPDEYILFSRDLLRNYSLNKSKFFVGLHFRSAFDNATLRNTSIENAKYICKLIKSQGGDAFLVGANESLSRKLKKYTIDIKSICNSVYEYEALQLFLWSKCDFWVGSQSGGTNPASLFGNLTLWLDYHPSGHFHPPNMTDIFIPRRIFSKKLGRYLTWQESISDQHRFCQTEDPLYAKNFGYKIQPANKESIKDAFKYCMDGCVLKSKKVKNSDLISRVFYKHD